MIRSAHFCCPPRATGPRLDLSLGVLAILAKLGSPLKSFKIAPCSQLNPFCACSAKNVNSSLLPYSTPVGQQYRRPGIRTRNLQSCPPSQTPVPPRDTTGTRRLGGNVLPRPSVIRMRAETSHLRLRMLSLECTFGSLARPTRGACAEPAARGPDLLSCVLWLPLLLLWELPGRRGLFRNSRHPLSLPVSLSCL